MPCVRTVVGPNYVLMWRCNAGAVGLGAVGGGREGPLPGPSVLSSAIGASVGGMRASGAAGGAREGVDEARRGTTTCLSCAVACGSCQGMVREAGRSAQKRARAGTYTWAVSGWRAWRISLRVGESRRKSTTLARVGKADWYCTMHARATERTCARACRCSCGVAHMRCTPCTCGGAHLHRGVGGGRRQHSLEQRALPGDPLQGPVLQRVEEAHAAQLADCRLLGLLERRGEDLVGRRRGARPAGWSHPPAACTLALALRPDPPLSPGPGPLPLSYP